MSLLPGRRAALFALVLATSARVLAQTGGLAEGPGVIPEITVTARKREETLQDVPLSVAAFTGEQLQAMGLTSDYDIANFTIGFDTLQQTGRDIDRPIIRGMGNPASRGEPNASYFIDGVFVSGSISTATTSAVERVEILRGPQSAQFGRATFSGAVNYVTRRPGETFEAELNTRAGSHEDYNLGGWLSGPLVAGRLYFLLSANWSRYGGQWRNELQAGPPGTPGAAGWESETRPGVFPFRTFLADPPQDADRSRLGQEETWDFLAKVVWRPTDSAEVTLRYGYTEGDDTHFPSLIAPELNCFLPTPETVGEPWYATTQGFYCGRWTAAGRVNRINLPDFRAGVTTSIFTAQPGVTVSPAEPGTFREQHRVLLEYRQDVRDYRFTARGAWNRDDFQQVFDLDHTETRAIWGIFHFDNQRFIDDYSVELRLETPADRRLRGQLGLYWYDQDRQNRQRSFVGPLVVFGQLGDGFPPSTFIDTTNKAVFGAIDLDLAEEWTLTAEARWAEDEKTLSGGVFGNCDPVVVTECLPLSAPARYRNFTPRFTLQWRPADDLNLYALAAKGNKPGDFNTEFVRSGIRVVATNDALFEGCTDPALIFPTSDTRCARVAEEEQWTYELGAKTTWLDRRIAANLALYYIDWENQGLFTITNILQDTGTFLATTIVTNAGRSRVIGAELETSAFVTDRLSLVANYGYTDSEYRRGTDGALTETIGNGELRGRKVPNVPRHTVILGANATAPTGMDGIEFFLSPDLSYSTKRYQQPANLGWVGSTTLLNLRLGLQANRWTLTGYVSNLLDEDSPIAALDFVNFGLTPETEPRINYPVNEFGNLLNDRDPRLFSLNPRRGRDIGVEFQYRWR